jgi:hypothetical protein
MRAETTSEKSSILNISGKAGKVKCNIRIVQDLNTNIRRPIVNKGGNEPLDRHKSD